MQEAEPVDRDQTFVGEGRQARRPTVLLGFTGDQHWRLPLPETGQLVLGRAEGCALVLNDARVSRRHCCLHLSSNVMLEDLGSKTGTRLMGRTLERGEKTLLKRGDVFELGETSVVCHSSAPAPSEPGRIGTGPCTAMEELRRLIDRVAHSRINVLISGETGVGKGVLAAELHRRSPRAGQAFVALNCAELQESLLESELFGHERGAFTGANASKPGLIESADGGTLFLDEIGEMSLATQAKLLRVLEDRSVRRVGSLQSRPVDVRLLTASNRNLAAESERGAFRRDLYFRLNGILLEVPPLRERLNELEGLAYTFLAQACEAQRRHPPALTWEALDALRRHAWPGNIRELRNVVERAVLLCTGEAVTLEHVPLPPKVVPLTSGSGPASEPPASPSASSDEAASEKKRIEAALEQCAGNQSRAAKLLGISRATLVARLDRYGFPRPRKQTA